MSENITVTGNKAQFNEDVVFLKDTDIRGSILFGETGTITAGLLNIDGDLATDNLLIREDLDVLGNSDFSGIHNPFFLSFFNCKPSSPFRKKSYDLSIPTVLYFLNLPIVLYAN